jgi:trk system potassium uptake protein
MKVVILGAGRVGYNIARYLATEENDVTVVDICGDLLKKISDTLDIQPIQGYASHPEVLEQAGLENADLLIAVTASDEVNIVACEVANSLFNVNKKIARIRNQSYLDPNWVRLFAPHHLAIDYIISPEVEVAQAISRSVRVMGAFDVISLILDDVKVVGVRCRQSAPILNTPLRLLPGLFPKYTFVIATIVRDDRMFIPTEDDQILLNDEVYFIAHRRDISDIMAEFNVTSYLGRRVLIMGAGSIGLTLAVELEKSFSHAEITIIEKKPERAEFVARHLKNTEVLCGDVLDLEVLSEAGIEDTDTTIAITEDDKVNILSSLLAKRRGANRTLTLLNHMEYSSLVTSLGVDAVVSPHAITVSSILQHVRQGQIHSVHSLRDGEVEVIEAEVQETSNIIGLDIEDVNIRGKILVAAISRAGQTTLLPSKSIIRVGDRLIIIVTKNTVHKVERLFAVRPFYL